MSDSWIILIPRDPQFVPDVARQKRARDRFAEIAPNAEEIKITVCETIRFFDCGENFERILCHSCSKEVPVAWWQDRMDEDYSNGFGLTTHVLPCCGVHCTLNDILYEWPQGFGRFALEAMNTNLGSLEDRFKQEIEDLLETKLRVIYQHI